MKLAVSNLAWNLDENDVVAEIMQRHAVRGVELAPTKYWPALEQAAEAEVKKVRKQWALMGIEVCALQSLLFGRNDLMIFADAAKRAQTTAVLKKAIDIAQWLGAPALVFGSPKNRARGGISIESAHEIAVPFFRELGDYAGQRNCSFCIEPNPTAYACDFVTTSSEGADLVAAVGSQGFGLHLDSAGMQLSGENGGESIRKAARFLKHFHISAPNLNPVDAASPVDYAELVSALEEINFAGWTSIEMKPNPAGGNVVAVERAITYSKSVGFE